MFVQTEGPPGAKIFLVGEAPGATEDRIGKPFAGDAGRLLEKFLTQARINRHECLIANVARERPAGNNMKLYYEDSRCTIPKPKLQEWIDLLKEELLLHQPNIVVAMGAHALYTLTGMKGIEAYRGTLLECSLVPGLKVLPTFHPQAVGYEPKKAFATLMDFRKIAHEQHSKGLPEDHRTIRISESADEFEEYAEMLLTMEEPPKVAVDIEVIPPYCHMDYIAFAHSNEEAFVLRILNNNVPVFNHRDELRVWQTLSRLARSDIKWIIHNAVFDWPAIFNATGILLKNVYMDTMLAAHCCWPEQSKSLGFLASIMLSVPAWKHESQVARAIYNGRDALNTRAIANSFEQLLDGFEVRHTYDFEMSQVEVASMLQLQGLYIDYEKQQEYKKKLTEDIQKIKEAINTLAEREVNLNSPKQLQEFLYIDLGLPVQYKRRTSKTQERKVTTDEEALKKILAKTGHAAVKMLMEHRKKQKLLSSFVDITLEDTEDEGLKKVYASYNIGGTATGRWSSDSTIIKPYGSGNLQNIAREIRDMYVAPPGYQYLQADYIQAEAVVVSYLIKDERLKRAFKEGDDVHKLTASLMFGKDINNVTPDERRIGKTLRHATNYSAGPAVVANQLQCTMGDARKLLDQFHVMCPQLRIWHEAIRRKLQQDRTLVNLLGRKRRFYGEWNDDLFRSAYSYIPQGTIGDLMNSSLVNFYQKWGDQVLIAKQLHDAVYLWVPLEEDLYLWARRLRDEMIQPIDIHGTEMIIDVDFQYGPAWGGMKKLELD